MRSIALTALYLSALAGGTYSAFRPTFDSSFARTQTETGDGMLNHYMLEHSWRAVSDSNYRGGLLEPPFFYPASWVYWYSETLLGGAPIYWALRLGLPDDLAYQWWQIVCTGLNFAAFALVARWLRWSHISVILGAFFWAFATSHIHQQMHQQLIPRFWMPIAVYHAWQLVLAPNLRSLNRTLAFTFLQAATCVYTGWFLTMGLAVFIGVAANLKPGGWNSLRVFAQVEWPKVRLAAGLWCLAFGAFFAPYVIANRGGGRAYGDCIECMPTTAAWFKGPEGSRWHETLDTVVPEVHDECCLFGGFALYLLVLTAGINLWRGRRAAVWPPKLIFAAACLATAAIGWLLTLNIYQGASAWWFIRFFPGGGAIRCVSRVCLIVDLFAVLGAEMWLNAVTDQIRATWQRALVVGAIATAIIFEQTGYVPKSFAKEDFYPTVKQYGERIQGADAAYIVPQKGQPALYTEVMAMWAGLEANVPVVNGYSGRRPPGYPYDFAFPLDGYTDQMLIGWLTGKFRGRVAILDPNDRGQVRYLDIE